MKLFTYLMRSIYIQKGNFMKKTIQLFGLIAILAVMVHTPTVYAVTIREARKDVIEARKDLMQEKKEFREDIREKIASKVAAVKSLFKGRVSFGQGKLTAINGTTLTVEKDGKSYTVLTGTFEKCTTQYRRRFWGSSSMSEFTVGDTVNVAGKFTDENKTTIEACVIRDVSIQKRFGVFVGEIVSVTGSGWVMTTVSEKRSNQTVTVTSSTKYTNRKNETISQSDIKVGNRVRVKGLWNRTNNTVTDVTQVKNYSLPPVVSGTASPTPTP